MWDDEILGKEEEVAAVDRGFLWRHLSRGRRERSQVAGLKSF